MQKHGLRVACTALMTAISLMAFSASAHAAELKLVSRHLIIRIAGVNLAIATPKTLAGKQEGPGTLSIPAKSSEIVCEKAELINATAENETDTQKNPEGKELTEKSESGLAAMGQGKVEYSGCKVFTFKLEGEKKVELKESAPCTKVFNEKNKNAKGEAGHPIGHGLILLYLHHHQTPTSLRHRRIIRITTLPGLPFSTLEFGGTCSLPETVKVTGSVAGEITTPAEEGKTVSVKFETETAEGKELSAIAETKLLFGASEAFLEGKVNAELPGNEKWGIF